MRGSATLRSLPFAVLLAAQPAYSQASSPGLDLRSTPLSEVVSAYYRVMSSAPYVVCPAVEGSLAKVSVRAPSSLSRQALRTMLSVNGFTLTVRQGIDVICDAPDQSVQGHRISAYGPPEAGPLTPPAVASSPSSGPVAASVPAGAPTVAAVERAPDDARLVYRTRYRAVQELLPLLQGAGLGHFASIGGGVGSADGSSSTTIGGAPSDILVWSGQRSESAVVKELLLSVDVPIASADVEFFAVAVSEADTGSRALSVVSSVLGLGNGAAGSASGFSVKLGAVRIGFDALDSDRRLRVVKRYHGTLRSNDRVQLADGGSVPVIGQLTESSTGRVTQAINYSPTGLTLKIAPVVLDSEVRLAVSLQDQSVIGGASSTSPSFETRSFEGSMALCYGCLSVVSGLEQTTDDRSRSSFLGIIPLSRSKLVSHSRLVYVAYVHPRPSDDRAPVAATWGRASGALSSKSMNQPTEGL